MVQYFSEPFLGEAVTVIALQDIESVDIVIYLSALPVPEPMCYARENPIWKISYSIPFVESLRISTHACWQG